MDGILDGIRVIEGSAFVAAPLGGMTLAQLGADVIRFDPIGGGLDHRRWPVTNDGKHSLFWAGLNKGKRSIAVDIREPRGQEILTELICAPGAEAGLFSTNFPARGWLAYDRLVQHRADLIMVNLIGRRDGGSEVDYTVNPQIGFPELTGPSDRQEPTNHVFPAWDGIAGHQLALAMLAALRHRDRSGEGQLVTLALKDVASAMLGHLGMLAEVAINDVDRPRYGNYLYGAFGRDFETRDGARAMVIGLTGLQWKCLVKATDLSDSIKALGERLQLDLREEGNRFRAREEIAALLEPWFAERTLAEVRALFDEHRVTWGPYRSVREAMAEDADLSTDNPMFQNVEQPGIGTYIAPASTLAFSRAGRLPAKPAPRLGEHTDEILLDLLGLPEAEVGKLHDSGIIAGPST
ncbi:MAG: 2-methylfumaryl-CoA isomerase [Thiohalocapsa sp. PB-PSB1]|jgi:2-methylfumaryl-CoA isomerase|nr:MAG: dehydratase [Thiohalocapsa sp. PB-PSB1]QQO52135.1 MAG: 2-methylfumaryl-CoA isomerase [Thiohalocapsa sp. PB-PSB1]HCS92596.1 2-methylfumaryl-CoA isomerase [Chromatiaceae bacterium]